MGKNSVVKMGRSLVKTVVGKSRRVVKKSVGKVFESGALMDRLTNRLLEKSTALAVLDDRVSSACHSILPWRPKCASQELQQQQQQQQEEEEMVNSKEEDENGNEEALIPPPKGGLGSFSLDNNVVSSSTLGELVPPQASEEEEEEERGYSYNYYSSFSEEEFKEMVEGFIRRFNEHIAEEYNSTNDCHQIVFERSPCQRSADRVYS